MQSTEDLALSPSKMLVVAGLAGKDFTWINSLLADWDSIIYIPDDSRAPHHPAQNKGREANMYLTYIIENYGNLRDLTAFIHWDRFGWHNDYFNRDLTLGLRNLKVNYVLSQKYTNLRCTLEPGCKPVVEIMPFRQPLDNRTTFASFPEA
ncbi:hypothetical protein MMC10_008712 [Thelotrema lepadinum]|nr:hypothetical protein [Thelotrema lepadinum]